jgi:hypothetical protein
MKNQIPLDQIDELFKRISDSEPWADKISFKVVKRLSSPYLEYHPELHDGIVYLPPYDNLQVIAEAICHEIGHFIDGENNPPRKLDLAINEFIQPTGTLNILRKVVTQFYLVVFWRLRMNRELCAHQEAIKLVKKINMPLSIFQETLDAERQLTTPTSRYNIILKCFQRRLRINKDRITLAAINASNTQ